MHVQNVDVWEIAECLKISWAICTLVWATFPFGLLWLSRCNTRARIIMPWRWRLPRVSDNMNVYQVLWGWADTRLDFAQVKRREGREWACDDIKSLLLWKFFFEVPAVKMGSNFIRVYSKRLICCFYPDSPFLTFFMHGLNDRFEKCVISG